MKYFILAILLIASILMLCSCNKEGGTIRTGEGNLIIEYTNVVQMLANNESFVRIYDNRKVEYGNKYEDNTKEFILEEEKYNEIVNLAFSKKVLSLEGKDLSDPNVLDGYYRYITLYTEDGKEIRIGGSNPSNKTFNSLVSLINNTIK